MRLTGIAVRQYDKIRPELMAERVAVVETPVGRTMRAARPVFAKLARRDFTRMSSAGRRYMTPSQIWSA
jgi:hypothetical protein